MNFSTLSSDFRPRSWFPMAWEWFPMFLWSYHRKKNIVEEIESIMGARAERSSPSWICFPQKSPVRTGDHPREFVFHRKITPYRSWFLEYKLTRMNSVSDGRPWWILYVIYRPCTWVQTRICRGCTIIGSRVRSRVSPPFCREHSLPNPRRTCLWDRTRRGHKLMSSVIKIMKEVISMTRVQLYVLL